MKKQRTCAYIKVPQYRYPERPDPCMQPEFFETLIKDNPELEFVGVYVDLSGTTHNTKPDLDRMIADCEAGKIDLVIVPQLSVLANDVPKLKKTVSRLHELGVVIVSQSEDVGYTMNEMSVAYEFSQMLSQREDELVASPEYIRSSVEHFIEYLDELNYNEKQPTDTPSQTVKITIGEETIVLPVNDAVFNALYQAMYSIREDV